MQSTQVTTSGTFNNQQQNTTTLPVKSKMASQKKKSETAIPAVDLQVEQALLDLNELQNTEALVSQSTLLNSGGSDFAKIKQPQSQMAFTQLSGFDRTREIGGVPNQRDLLTTQQSQASVYQATTTTGVGGTLENQTGNGHGWGSGAGISRISKQASNVGLNNFNKAQAAQARGTTQSHFSATQGSFFSASDHRNGQNGTVSTALDGLSGEQLRERLLVAETIMKKLYNRNKELEEFHGQNLNNNKHVQKQEAI